MESASIQQPKRLLPLDALRGLIMILMAIDHANFFVARLHPTGEFWGVPLPQYNNIAEFLTRLVTHICAPGFFFLMGVGMVLFAHSRRSLGWSERKISQNLFLRALFCFFVNSFSRTLHGYWALSTHSVPRVLAKQYGSTSVCSLPWEPPWLSGLFS